MTREPDRSQAHVPRGYPCSVMFIDESGQRASGSDFFVVAAVKVREHGRFAQAIREVRTQHQYWGEFKFADLNRGTLTLYYSLVDALESLDVTFAACVVDGSVSNPFGQRATWQVHAELISQLVVGCAVKRELLTVLMDTITAPQGRSAEDQVRRTVNSRFNSTKVVAAACLDSKCSDGLQVADLVASAVAFDRRRTKGISGNPNSNKAKVAARLRASLGVDCFDDMRTARVNIATYRGRRSERPKLHVVHTNEAS